MASKTIFTWSEVEIIVDRLVKKIVDSGFMPDLIVGITLGGLVPLALVAKKLGINNVRTISVVSYDKDQQKELRIIHFPDIDAGGRRVLIVDEIADTGRTLKTIVENAREQWRAGEIKTATFVVKRNRSAIIPDFYALDFEGDEFIIFPWEKNEFPECFENSSGPC